MSERKSGRSSWLIYCLVAVVLAGSFLLVNGFQADNSATMAPHLPLAR
ncbi:hypothetical protein [Bradyrhizobium sp.]|nr:hypothetical protein [Bradyrhizobium sp.]MBI5317997.1 hypothetical protein [Bradyrhizobium sp.]